MTRTTEPRLTSFAPQFLVDDLDRSIHFYEKLGFKFGETWEGFYVIGHLDGFELHPKVPPKKSEDLHHTRRASRRGRRCRRYRSVLRAVRR